MDQSSIVSVGVTLVETTGMNGRVGSPRTLLRFAAVHLPGTPLDDGRISIVAQDPRRETWFELSRQTTIDEAIEVATRVDALRLNEGEPDIRGRFDTSDSWVHLLVHVQRESATRTLEVNMQSSGLEGSAAPAFRELHRYLCSLARHDSQPWDWWA